MNRYRVTHLVDARGARIRRPVVVEAESSALAKMVAAHEIGGAWTDDTEVELLPQLRMNKRQLKIEALNGAADLIEIAVEEGALYSKDANDEENIFYQEMLEKIAISLRRQAIRMKRAQRGA